jgi:hypothetical protein
MVAAVIIHVEPIQLSGGQGNCRSAKSAATLGHHALYPLRQNLDGPGVLDVTR